MMVSHIAFWFRLTRNEHPFTSGLLVGHGHTNTTSQNNATVSASHAIRIHVCVCQVEMAQHVVALTMFVGLIVSTWVIWFRHSMLVDPTTSNNRSKAMPQLGQLVNGCCQVVSVERHVLRDDLQEVLTICKGEVPRCPLDPRFYG